MRLIAWVTAIALPVEMALITAAAGTTSHFNVSSTARTLIWQTMAVAIIVTWIMCLVAAVLLLRQRLAAAGMAVALLMTTRAASEARTVSGQPTADPACPSSTGAR